MSIMNGRWKFHVHWKPNFKMNSEHEQYIFCVKPSVPRKAAEAAPAVIAATPVATSVRIARWPVNNTIVYFWIRIYINQCDETTFDQQSTRHCAMLLTPNWKSENQNFHAFMKKRIIQNTLKAWFANWYVWKRGAWFPWNRSGSPWHPRRAY